MDTATAHMELANMAQDMQEALTAIHDTILRTNKCVIDKIVADPKEGELLAASYMGGEAFAVAQMLYFLRHSYASGILPAAIPASEQDTIRREYGLKTGRADIVVFHIDGTASVIEVKDGATGYRNIVAGIGQASMYACQLGLVPGSIRSIRRVLAWDSCRDKEHNKLIAAACRLAGVIPVQLLTKRQLSTMYSDLMAFRFNEAMNARAQQCGFATLAELQAHNGDLIGDMRKAFALSQELTGSN